MLDILFGIFLLVTYLIFLATVTALIASAVMNYESSDMRAISGSIIDSYTDDANLVYPVYSYTLNGMTYSYVADTACKDKLVNMLIGHSCIVYYDSHNPSVSKVKVNAIIVRAIAKILIIVGFVCSLIGAFFWIPAIWIPAIP